MRTLILVVLLAMATQGVSGCSTTGKPKQKIVKDEDKIAYVNALARRRGTQVIWVHLPKIRADANADAAQAMAQNTTP